MSPTRNAGRDLALIRSDKASWDDLATYARSSPIGIRGAALMSLGQRFPDEPRTVALLEELVASPTRNERLMGIATVGHVCLLLLREMKGDLAQATFSRLRDAWDACDRPDLEVVLKHGL
jgi:hypothetical protein